MRILDNLFPFSRDLAALLSVAGKRWPSLAGDSKRTLYRIASTNQRQNGAIQLNDASAQNSACISSSSSSTSTSSSSSSCVGLNYASDSHRTHYLLRDYRRRRLRLPEDDQRLDYDSSTKRFSSISSKRPLWTLSSSSSSSFSSCSFSSPPLLHLSPRHFDLFARHFQTSTRLLTKRGSERWKKTTVYHDKKPVAEVWKGMTARELARSIDEEPEALVDSLKLSSTEDRIYDNALLQEVVKNSTFRCHLVQRYVASESVTSDLDASPRQPPSEKEQLRLPKRHPVVTIMGHVDHGKTTLLDRLRNSNIVSQEFGGITQHIGAFSFVLPSSGSHITFLDTPGHAAFSAMRGRGANVTDIVILVVAAEDGVMSQTEESINHAQSAGVPIVVAINKIDRPQADIELTKRSLMECGLTLEEIGGEVMCVPISALVGTNVDQLMEAVLTQAELLDLRADSTGLVEATVIETRRVDGRGKLATVLVERGTLKPGAFLVAGAEGTECKVKRLADAEGKAMREAKPAEPVEVMGWKDLPSPGDKVLQLPNEKRLRQVASLRKERVATEKFLEARKIAEQQKAVDRQNYEAKYAARVEAGRRRLRIPDFRREKEDKSPVDSSHPFLNVVLRGDVDGSLEAILNVFDSFDDDRCKLDVVNFGVGPPTTSEVDLASTFQCIIYCFNLRVPGAIESLAKEKGVELVHFNVIYRLFEHMKTEMTVRLPPLNVDDVIGVANVMQPFTITDDRKRKRPVAGSQCVKGELHHDARFKLIRAGKDHSSSSSSSTTSPGEDDGDDDGVAFDGPLFALKHFKEDVKSISQGMDCGIALGDLEVEPRIGDQILCYRVKQVKQNIQWDLDF